MIRLSFSLAAAAVAAFNGTSAWAADPLPSETHKVLTTEVAVDAAQAAIASCKEKGYKVSVVIVDRTGTTKLVLIGEGTSKTSQIVTPRKAYTAAMLRVPTTAYAKRVATPGAFNPGVFDTQLTTEGGGVPIKVGEDTIAGIGVGGAPGGELDEACANAGIAKISDRLN